MKVRMTEFYANILMSLGTYLHKFGNKILDKSFLIHQTYNTDTGKKITEIAKIITEYASQSNKDVKKFNKESTDTMEKSAFYIKRGPRRDN